jgi:hypothetical protein
MAFGATQVVDSDKPMSELFQLAERALSLIGTVKQADPQAGRITGVTKYGWQKVKLSVEFSAVGSGTQMTIVGRSDDVAGVGASAGIARLLEVMENPDRLAGDPTYLKQGMSTGRKVAVLVGFVVLLLMIVVRYLVATS